MPTVSGPTLTLTTVDTRVTVDVKYKVTFTKFERKLASLGLKFSERIAIMGMDPAGATTGTELDSFDNAPLAVTDGEGSQIISRSVSKTVPRALLQEDPTGDDEIRCRVRIVASGFPPAETADAFTDQKVLLG